jgi:hypothetical protein
MEKPSFAKASAGCRGGATGGVGACGEVEGVPDAEHDPIITRASIVYIWVPESLGMERGIRTREGREHWHGAGGKRREGSKPAPLTTKGAAPVCQASPPCADHFGVAPDIDWQANYEIPHFWLGPKVGHPADECYSDLISFCQNVGYSAQDSSPRTRAMPGKRLFRSWPSSFTGWSSASFSALDASRLTSGNLFQGI